MKSNFLLFSIVVCGVFSSLSAQINFTNSNQSITGSTNQCVAVGNIDADLDIDIISASNSNGPIYIHKNNGSGIMTTTTTGTNRNYYGLALADLDGDGFRDIIAAVTGTGVLSTIYFNDGTGIFTNSGDNFGNGSGVATGDIDGDGDIDILLVNTSGAQNRILRNNAALFNNGHIFNTNSYTNCQLKDIDGDGDLDAILGGQFFVDVFKNNGAGVFSSTVQSITAGRVNLKDVDGDGDQDLITFNTDVVIHKNNGTGTFTVFQTITGVPNNMYAYVDMGDIDGDGDIDLYIPFSGNGMDQVWINNGSGTFTNSNATLQNSDGYDARLADLNGNGRLDVYIANRVNTDQIWFNNSTPCTPPTLNITGTTTICNGNNTTLTASGASIYSWNTTATTAAITVSPTTTTTYTVYGTATDGCTNTHTVTVTVNPLPTVTITGTSTICTGNNTTLTGNGANTYSWNTTATTAAITVSPTTTTTYTVYGTSSAGCTNTQTVTVTVNALPTVTYTETQTPICIFASSITLTPGSPSNGTYSGPGVTGNTFDPATAGAGTHTITYSYTDGNGCTNTATSQITVDLCTGLQQYDAANQLILYPNPTSGSLNIVAKAGVIYSIVLSDINGKIIYALDEKNNSGFSTKTLDLSCLSNGVYFVKITTDIQVLNTKVILNK